MSAPELSLILFVEDADDLGTPLRHPRRIVQLTQMGVTTTFLAPSGGPPIVTIEHKSLKPGKFQELWKEHRG